MVQSTAVADSGENVDVVESLVQSQDNINRHVKLNMDTISACFCIVYRKNKQILSTPLEDTDHQS